MSYEDALQLWKQQEVRPPAFTEVERARRWGVSPDMPSRLAVLGARMGLLIAALGYLYLGYAELYIIPTHYRGGRYAAVLFPLLTLAMAWRWMEQRELGRQMMVRAFAWSNLVIGVLIGVWGLITQLQLAGVPLALGAGVALMALNGKGLGITSGPFRPVAFRNQLLIALVLAMADAQTLVFGGTMLAWGGRTGDGMLTLLCGLVMGIAVWGIYRMRVWALLLNIVANLGIAFLAMSGYLGLSIPVSTALALTATMQLLLPVPIIARAMGEDTRDRVPLGPFGPWFARLVIIGAMIAGMGGWTLPMFTDYRLLHRPGWVEYGGMRSMHRGAPPYPAWMDR